MPADFLCEGTREGRYERFGTRVGRKHRRSDLSSERPKVQNQPSFSTIRVPVSYWICEEGMTDRWIMPGSTACVTRTVPSILIVTMSSFSCSVVSAKYVGIVCDLPTLFTVVTLFSRTSGVRVKGGSLTEDTNVQATDDCFKRIECRRIVFGEIDQLNSGLYFACGLARYKRDENHGTCSKKWTHQFQLRQKLTPPHCERRARY